MSFPISLVMTVYNRERYLATAIESVLKQTRTDFELLIWDDGSTDNSLAIAQQYAQSNRRIRVIAAPHQGLGKSLTDAIEQTTGIYLGWLDSDDLLDSDGIDHLFNAAQDYDLCLRLSEITEIYHLQQPLYFYRKHQETISHKSQFEQIHFTHKAITQALKRRGLDDKIRLEIQIRPQFILRYK